MTLLRTDVLVVSPLCIFNMHALSMLCWNWYSILLRPESTKWKTICGIVLVPPLSTLLIAKIKLTDENVYLICIRLNTKNLPTAAATISESKSFTSFEWRRSLSFLLQFLDTHLNFKECLRNEKNHFSFSLRKEISALNLNNDESETSGLEVNLYSERAPKKKSFGYLPRFFSLW